MRPQKIQSSVRQEHSIVVARADFVDINKAYIVTLWRNHYCKAGVFTYKDIEFLRDTLTAILEGREGGVQESEENLDPSGTSEYGPAAQVH